MELIRGYRRRHFDARGCVATIGNFDGIHLGHQAVLDQLAEQAAALDLPAVVVTFEPHPQEFFRPDSAPLRLTTLREKLQALQGHAVDQIVCLPFNRALAEMPAQDFIHQVLVASLGVRCLVIGADFRFGHRRQGDIAMLQAEGQRAGFQVIVTHTFELGEARVSSTRIRAALQQGELESAAKLLGRPYRLSGRVVSGDRRGRELGFPTANIHLNRRRIVRGGTGCTPLAGVFAVQVYDLERIPVRGVANFGLRPTVDGTRCTLEVHILDFEGDIYGRQVQVEFLARLRMEQRFGSLDALRQQIGRDVIHARNFFKLDSIRQNRLTGSTGT